jgi:tRNA threonylcarbamoyladenosine biosynthesis protein TsaE
VVRVSRRAASLAETRSLARQLSDFLRPGDVVLLIGELGAGKTAFSQGLGAALGVVDDITSPTFTIMRDYPVVLPSGRSTTFLHLDAYRLEGPAAVDDIGLFEMLDAGAFAVIEWGDIVAGAFGTDPLVIEFFWETEESRAIVVSADTNGPWAERWASWFAPSGVDHWYRYLDTGG